MKSRRGPPRKCTSAPPPRYSSWHRTHCTPTTLGPRTCWLGRAPGPATPPRTSAPRGRRCTLPRFGHSSQACTRTSPPPGCWRGSTPPRRTGRPWGPRGSRKLRGTRCTRSLTRRSRQRSQVRRSSLSKRWILGAPWCAQGMTGTPSAPPPPRTTPQGIPRTASRCPRPRSPAPCTPESNRTCTCHSRLCSLQTASTAKSPARTRRNRRCATARSRPRTPPVSSTPPRCRRCRRPSTGLPARSTTPPHQRASRVLAKGAKRLPPPPCTAPWRAPR
mmetsp:Transcript_10182/g.24686  ORF Transcript_10182/g.24686 Transcript_10182/m.24686 type:complete len:275 (-) Transcript_10182:2564-3388(-)